MVTRRKVLQAIGVAPLAAVACTSSSDGGGDDDSSGAPDASPGPDADPDGWATGGTDAMTDQDSYPDPFEDGPGATCALTCAATLGPCYADTLDRKDISEGEDGLPVRMAFLVVDDNCQPVPNAIVDVWHTSANGFYSGSDASAQCTLGNADAESKRFFRGVQTTDARGRVDFDTCFPGWYSGRTIHIHFQVRVGGTEYLTSQLYWPDSLCDEIIDTQPIYSARGERKTTNATDGRYSSSD
jgi:protocatechuate 3,4-dioxygenase beta subunit